MSKSARLLVFAPLFSLAMNTAADAVAPGDPAPPFALADLGGKPVSLDSLKGRWLILEWTNPECPFVQKHYGSGNMQETQRFAGDRRIVWVQINSTSPRHSDHHDPAQMRDWNARMKAAPAYATLDESGAAGRSYGAKTTPHLYLIDPDGRVVYNGAIDDRRSADPADIPGARNHVREALTEVLAGRPVSVAATTPYGCSIKY